MPDPFPPLLTAAVRFAAAAHDGQVRKGSGEPYLTHPLGVMVILGRSGWGEDDDLLAAAALHDVLEDTPTTPADLAARFPPRVCELIAALSERKRDGTGAKIPWEVRKAEHRTRLAAADAPTRALALADKLHNLRSLQCDLANGADAWESFNAPRDRWVEVTRATVDALRCGATAGLADACDAAIAELAATSGSASSSS